MNCHQITEFSPHLKDKTVHIITIIITNNNHLTNYK